MATAELFADLDFDAPNSPTPPTLATTGSAAEKLQVSFAAARVSFSWFGTRKTLTSDQRDRAGETFGADGEYLSAGKKLLDTKHPAYKALTQLKGAILDYWRQHSLPFPEDGLRLIKQSFVQEFDGRMSGWKEQLEQSVIALDEVYGELREAARQKLGALYDPADYPQSLVGLFSVAWDFPSVTPPDYLQQLNPELYEREAEKIRARFAEAASMAEEAFTSELAKLVSHLTERLTGATDDGRPKIFRDSAVENLQEFFTRFSQLNIRSNAQLDALVSTARAAVSGVGPQDLRESGMLRSQVAERLAAVGEQLDGMMIAAPRRALLRKPKGDTAAE